MNVYKSHGYRVAMLCKAIYKKRVDENLFIAALLHDVGKSKLDQRILNKKGRLDPEEYEHVKKHVRYSKEELSKEDFSKDIQEYVLYHHENYDGSGYLGLEGEKIPLGARMIRIVDVFDALTSDRSYKQGVSIEKALEIMDAEAEYYDKELYRIFKEYISDTVSLDAGNKIAI